MDGLLKDRKAPALFIGSHCFPLSPRNGDFISSLDCLDEHDQLRVILRQLGKQSKMDLGFMKDEENEDYAKVFQVGLKVKEPAFISSLK